MLQAVFCLYFWNRDSLPDPRPDWCSGAVVASQREDQDQLFDVFQFRSQCQQFCFTGDLAWMLGIESNASESISGCFIHLPGERKGKR
jgi:hypothetical protein